MARKRLKCKRCEHVGYQEDRCSFSFLFHHGYVSLRVQNTDYIFSLPDPGAQMHEAKGAKQGQEASRRSSLLVLARAAMLLLSNVQAQPAARSENRSRRHRAPLASNVSLQMEVTDRKPFPSAAMWSHPEPVSPCPAGAKRFHLC